MRFFKSITLTLIILSLSLAQISLSLTDFDADSGTVDVYMVNDTAVGGFQFQISGFSSFSTSGGSAADAGFTISTGGSTILGFSFSGASIPPGEGVLTTISGTLDGSDVCLDLGATGAVSDPSGVGLDTEVGPCAGDDGSIAGCTDDTACNYNADATEDDGSCTFAEENYDCDGNCTADIDCNGDCGGSALEDDCGVCDGDNSCVASLSFGSVTSDNMEILIDSPENIGGFQFSISGLATVNGASGGLAQDSGFTVSTGNNIVIGFSLTGSTIAAGSGVLTNLDYVCDYPGSNEACITDIVISDAAGLAIPSEFTGGCVEVGDFAGCTDEAACNYNSGATEDDGSCLYNDCAGECGGDAVEDICGDCGGSATEMSECVDSFYNTDLAWTGSSQLIIFQDTITGLEVGDQIGIFDAAGIIDGSGNTGEVLVGPALESGPVLGMWDGEQLSLTAIGSVDMSQFAGPILPGYAEGNAVMIKVYRESTGLEYAATATYSAGSGSFGDLFMAISELTLGDVLDNDEVWMGPESYTLNQNYPNPFNPETQISFDAGISGEISIVVYDILGNKVKTIMSGFVTPGHYVASWDATDDNGGNVSSGVYIYSLVSPEQTISKRMLLVK